MYSDEWRSEPHTLVVELEDGEYDYTIEHPRDCPTEEHHIFGTHYCCAVQYHVGFAGFMDLIPTGEELAPGRYTIVAWSHTIDTYMYGRECDSGLDFAGNR